RAAYGAIRISTTQVTLTSRSGVLPLTLTNGTGYAVEVTLRFVADRRLEFENGNSYRVLLTGSSRTLTFRVRAETTGRFPITVDLETPAGATPPDTIAQTVMVVRSTAYNKVALVLTIGAALFLGAWWGRRFLPRKSHCPRPTRRSPSSGTRQSCPSARRSPALRASSGSRQWPTRWASPRAAWPTRSTSRTRRRTWSTTSPSAGSS